MTAKQRRVLAIVATDATFEAARQGDARVWVGKCLHCGRPLTVAADGTPISAATIEHIWPRNHGGGDELANVALACGRCNREKGGRHDGKPARDARLGAIVDALRARRRERWREPPEELAGHVAWARAQDAAEAAKDAAKAAKGAAKAARRRRG